MTKSDSGVYTATANNKIGEDVTDTLNVKVLGSPGPPTNLSVKDVTEKSAFITWEAPSDDGGSNVLSYTIDKRESNKTSWNSIKSDVSV